VRAALHEKVKDLLSKEEFEARVRAKAEEWGGLLDEDAAARLVLDALGRGTLDFQPVRDLRGGMEVTLRVRVDGVGPVREFQRQDGSAGRVVNLDVSDDTGRCRLVLWDDDVTLVARGRIAAGATLRLLDCFVRVSQYGTELSRGKFGTVLPEG
jgi:replication factor A1